MAGNREAAELRAAISRYREQTRAGKYPSELRKRAEGYAQRRVGVGATPAEIAAELGVRERTAHQWASSTERPAETPRPQTPAVVRSVPFVPVVVRPEPCEAAAMRLQVAFPDGTRLDVSGMSGRDLAEAIEAVRRVR
jgi:hypothetical protein